MDFRDTSKVEYFELQRKHPQLGNPTGTFKVISRKLPQVELEVPTASEARFGRRFGGGGGGVVGSGEPVEAPGIHFIDFC